MFAKLYETSVGQVLVKIDDGDGPEVRFFFEPPNLGVCSVALKFSDDDDGWDKAETAFKKVDEAQAVSIARSTIEKLGAAV